MTTTKRTFRSAVASVNATASVIAAADYDRNVLLLFNTGAVDVFIGLTAGTANIRIPVGSHMAFHAGIAPMNEIYGLATAGTGTLQVWSA